MGKKKTKGDKAEAGPKIPKRIGGVKLPKKLRHQGEALIAKAASPEGRAALAKGLTVAATLANLAAERGKAAKANGAARPEPAAAKPGPDPANDIHPTPLDPAKVAEAVTTVADAVLGRLFPGKKV